MRSSQAIRVTLIPSIEELLANRLGVYFSDTTLKNIYFRDD